MGRRSAPSRPAPRPAAKPVARQQSTVARRPPPPAAAAPRAPPPAAAPAAPAAAPAQSGGMLSGIGSTIMQGMAFGTGSAIAHQAVGAVAKSISGSGDSNNQAAPAAPAPASAAATEHSTGPCHTDYQAFTQCVKQNPTDISQCDFYMQSLQSCQSAQA